MRKERKILEIGAVRRLPKIIQILILGSGAFLGFFVIAYVSGLLAFLNIYIQPGRVGVLVLLYGLATCYLMYPATKSEKSKSRVPWYDWLAFISCIVVNVNIYIIWLDVERLPATKEVVLGTLTVILIVEAVRRAISPGLALIGLIFAIYPFFANYLPGFLNGRPFSFERVITLYYMYGEGIYGTAMVLTSRVILIFLIFGAFLALSGAGDFFVDLSMALVGHVRGGPAKVAVIGSALLGMINGSAAANAATSGVITIPLMKKVGYKAHFGAAVEAVASNGGQMMPPVMGFVAFLMVDFLQVPYVEIVKAGFLVGALYFICVIVIVDFEAAKTGLKGLDREELPTVKKVLADGWFYLIPIGVLIFFLLVMKFSAETSCIYAILTLIGVSYFKKEVRLYPRKIAKGLFDGVRTLPNVGNVVALSGIMVAAINLTGIGVRMTGGILEIAGGNLFFLLLLTGVTAIVLGMGLPSIGIYILCAMLLTPALEQAGVPPLVAHFFVFYYGCASLITPPVCMVVYITSAIAKAPFMKSSLVAVRLGILTFILPFIFVYSPELLMIGTTSQIILAAITSVIGVVFMAGGLEGYLLCKTSIPVRIVLLAGGLTMIIPGVLTDVIGFAGGLMVVFWQLKKTKSAALRPITS